MADTREFKLINQLLENTRNGKLNWSGTSDSESFLATLGELGVRIGSRPSRTNGIPDEVDYVIEVVGIEGNVIDSFDDVDFEPRFKELSPNPYRIMKELFALARRKASGADAAIDYLLDELNK